jgi:hypothetical protein
VLDTHRWSPTAPVQAERTAGQLATRLGGPCSPALTSIRVGPSSSPRVSRSTASADLRSGPSDRSKRPTVRAGAGGRDTGLEQVDRKPRSRGERSAVPRCTVAVETQRPNLPRSSRHRRRQGSRRSGWARRGSQVRSSSPSTRAARRQAEVLRADLKPRRVKHLVFAFADRRRSRRWAASGSPGESGGLCRRQR